MKEVSWHWVKWVCNSKEREREGYIRYIMFMLLRTVGKCVSKKKKEEKWIKILKKYVC